MHYITYVNEHNSVIDFWIDEKVVNTNYFLDMHELNAINKKIAELGWGSATIWRNEL